MYFIITKYLTHFMGFKGGQLCRHFQCGIFDALKGSETARLKGRFNTSRP